MNKLLQGRRLQYLLYFIGLVTIGSAGFYIIGEKDWTIVDSIYMTIITLSTVGYGEVHSLSGAGKIWAILVIVFGVSGFAVIVYELGAELIQINTDRSRTMLKKISKLSEHYIICGFGRMGAVIASEFTNKNVPFVIIEENDRKIEYIQDLGYNYIQDDATLDNTLISAGIKGCKGIVVVLDNDQDNLFVTMSAKNLNKDSYIISRCSKKDTGDKLKRAGANKVVNPYITGGHRMAELLVSPSIDDITSLEAPGNLTVDFTLEEFNVDNLIGLNQKTIAKSKIKDNYNLLIVGIIEDNGETILNPNSDYILKNSQEIILIGSKNDFNEFELNMLK